MRFNLTPLVLAMTSGCVLATELGPLKETADFGEISIGGAYYYGESDWDTGTSRGDNLSENVIRDGYLGKFTVGLHPDLEVFVKAGKESIQKGSHSGLSSDNDDFFSVGGKAVLYRKDGLMVGPFIQYSEFSDYRIVADFAAGSTTIPMVAEVKALSTLEVGVAAQYQIQKTSVFGGIFHYSADADASGTFDGDVFSTGIEEDASVGVYAGVSQALTDRWNVGAEIRSASDLGAALSINYVFGQKKPAATRVERVVETVYVERTAPAGPSRLESEVHFATGSAEIAPEYLPNVREFAYFLTQYPKARGIIEGHCDCDGSDTYNMELSARRAQSIQDMLVKMYGIDPARLSVEYFGEAKPVADNESIAGKAANRRVRMVGIAN